MLHACDFGADSSTNEGRTGTFVERACYILGVPKHSTRIVLVPNLIAVAVACVFVREVVGTRGH